MAERILREILAESEALGVNERAATAVSFLIAQGVATAVQLHAREAGCPLETAKDLLVEGVVFGETLHELLEAERQYGIVVSATMPGGDA